MRRDPSSDPTTAPASTPGLFLCPIAEKYCRKFPQYFPTPQKPHKRWENEPGKNNARFNFRQFNPKSTYPHPDQITFSTQKAVKTPSGDHFRPFPKSTLSTKTGKYAHADIPQKPQKR
jgi:hypothetical protein